MPRWPSQQGNWDNLPVDEQASILAEAFETGDGLAISIVLESILKSVGGTELARRTGMTRPGLYEAFRGGRTPHLGTILKVLKGLGMRLTIEPLPDGSGGRDFDDVVEESSNP